MNTRVLTALMLVVVMVLSMAGCSTPEPVEDPIDGLIAESATDEVVDLLDQIAPEEESTNSFPVTLTVYNGEALLNFIDSVNSVTPTVYENTLTVSGATVDYVVDFAGTSCTMLETKTVNGEVQTQAYNVVQFGMQRASSVCADEAEFVQKMEDLDLMWMWQLYPYHALYGVVEVCAVTDQMEVITFDYYFDESVTAYFG